MSKLLERQRAERKKPLRYNRSENIIGLLNSWVIQNPKLAEMDQLSPRKQEARLFFENQMRLAIDISKNKPFISEKPKHPDRPYKGFYEFIHKMRDIAVERGFRFLFANKLKNGYMIPMIDGKYKVKNITIDDEGCGSCDLTRDDLSYHLEWRHNVPRFYYLDNMRDEYTTEHEHFNSNSEELEMFKKNVVSYKQSIREMLDQGMPVQELADLLDKMEIAISKLERD